jgi:hypothetical protein
MPPADHIHWPVFPILAARLKQIEVKLAQGHALPALYSKDESRQVLAGLDSSIKVTNVASCTGAPILDNYLEKIHAAFVSNHVLPNTSPQSQALIDSVNQLFCSKPCNRCGAATKCIASSKMANAQAVHQFGECIGVLRQLFAFVVEFCRELYARYAPGIAPPALALNTHQLGKRNPILDLAVSADTREQQPGQRSINIHLKVNEVDLDEYFACLYIMFHECFVHGWCGPALDSATASYSDAFHEGWMDWVGYDLLDERLRTGSHQLPGHLMTHWREFGTAGVKARGRRLSYWLPESHRSAASYASGDMAARLLFRFFHLVLDAPPHARAQFLRFSLSLNASGVGDEQRALLVLSVLERLDGDPSLILIKHRAVSRAIERFANGGPFQDLLYVLDSG